MNLIRATREAVEKRMSITDFDAILDMLASGGSPTYSGKLVSPRNAMGVSAVYACVSLVADDFATLPLLIYRWLEPDVSRERARDHYLWPLFTEEANARQSAYEFKQSMETWRNLWGNCFAEIEMNGRGQVLALWPWRADRVKVWAANPADVRSEIFYTYFPLDTQQKPITVPADRMFHVRNISIDGLVGLSPIEVHRQQVANMLAKQEHLGKFYANGAVIKGILSHPGKLGEKGQESLRASMKYYQGVSNAHRMMILEEGMKYEDVGMPMQDAQFVEMMNFDATDIARIYKVPPHKIGQLDRATNNNIEQQSIDYIQTTHMSIGSNWCGKIHASLLSARERQTIFAAQDYTYLMMADHTARANYYRAMQGILSPDQILEKEGYNPLPNGLGKLPRVPLNTIRIDEDTPDKAQNTSSAPPPAPFQDQGEHENEGAFTK